MTLSRRGLLGFALAAPAIIRTPGLLMPVRRTVELRRFFPVSAYTASLSAAGLPIVGSAVAITFAPTGGVWPSGLTITSVDGPIAAFGDRPVTARIAVRT